MKQMAWASAAEGAATLCAIYMPGNVLNLGGYDSPAIVNGCHDMSVETNLDTRTKIIQDTAEAVFKDFAAIFLISPSHIMAVRDGVEGIDFSRVEYNRFSNAVVN
jgi:hypothetical protein